MVSFPVVPATSSSVAVSVPVPVSIPVSIRSTIPITASISPVVFIPRRRPRPRPFPLAIVVVAGISSAVVVAVTSVVFVRRSWGSWGRCALYVCFSVVAPWSFCGWFVHASFALACLLASLPASSQICCEASVLLANSGGMISSKQQFRFKLDFVWTNIG